MDDLRELLELTSGLAADFYETLPDAAGVPARHVRGAARGVRGAAARGAVRPTGR